ncbi:hypothetical protein GLOIN_2v1567919 [Rhizophagus clarus]|uniref:Uncharacterized protein n=1 Tax=Rhizophagus clarus TaxID=94130 RepID=A0A8H3QU51_9GLOM|nr:hypothetical protein GLOIN_2v1567919 [Rhizophagus clarus]
MNQVQVNAKTSIKHANTNFYEPLKKKIVTRSTTTSHAILHRSILTEQQVQQQTLPPILSQQHTFPQHNYPQQHALTQQQYDPQLYSLPLIPPQQQNPNFNQLEIEQVNEGEEDGDCDQYQDPSDEKSESKWGHDEIKVLLDYIQENFSAWSKGNKPNSIMIWRRISINITIKLVMRERIETGAIIEEIVEIKEENKKQKQKSKNNVEVIAMAIAEISQTQERI